MKSERCPRIIKRCYRLLRRSWQLRRDPIAYARSIGVQIGENCRLLSIDAGTFGSEPYLIRLGNHVTITSGVRFITHDGGVWVFRQQHPDIDVIGPIIIGNNVFIGLNTIILPGVRIGDNCIIGAGSVITHDIPAGFVAAGVPARCIKTIDEYWMGIKDKAVHVRSLPEDIKRTIFLTHMPEE